MLGNEREHIHNYRIQRQVKERGHVYTFLLCRVSGCPEPHIMSIDKPPQPRWPRFKRCRPFAG